VIPPENQSESVGKIVLRDIHSPVRNVKDEAVDRKKLLVSVHVKILQAKQLHSNLYFT
jgi:hypothetical protein